jgi:hypothetical protein
VWVTLVHQRVLVEEANKRLAQKSAETAELRVAHATVREEATATSFQNLFEAEAGWTQLL